MTLCVEYTFPRGVWGHAPPGHVLNLQCRSAEVASGAPEGWYMYVAE